MNNLQKLTAILNIHSFETALVDGRLYAATSYTQNRAVYDEWVDVTAFSVKDLYGWLGY